MIYIAGDKHGFKSIKIVEEYLKENELACENLGVTKKNENMALEVMIPQVTSKVLENEENSGILTCGSGVGVEVGANKFSGIRACLATSPKIAQYAKIYDKCNVLCLVGWDATKENIYNVLDSWFESAYDGNQKRLKMFEEFNKWH